jgi:hypothetical protein
MRIIAFVLDEPTIERILAHIGEPTPAAANTVGAFAAAGHAAVRPDACGR